MMDSNYISIKKNQITTPISAVMFRLLWEWGLNLSASGKITRLAKPQDKDEPLVSLDELSSIFFLR